MKRIIVPTDFSDNAWNAFLYANKLAEKIKAEIVIINSYLEPQAIATNLTSMEDLLKEASESGLEEWMKRIESENLGQNLKIEEKSIHGRLSEALNKQIRGYGEKLIVMGSLGKTGALKKFLGSNAWDVVTNVKCPVFVIPPGASFSFSKKIALAADFNVVWEKVNLGFLRELCLLHPSEKLAVINIADTPMSEAVTKRSFNSFLEDIPYEIQVISGGNVSEALNTYVRMSKPDLLVLIKKKKGFIENIYKENITKKFTLLAGIQLLILKAER